jgi:hypothetical protein
MLTFVFVVTVVTTIIVTAFYSISVKLKVPKILWELSLQGPVPVVKPAMGTGHAMLITCI